MPPPVALIPLITAGEQVLDLVVTDVHEIKALVLPYTENGEHALENWSGNTETRLNEIKRNGIPEISAPMTELKEGVASKGYPYSTPFEKAKMRTILAVKTAAGALTEAQMSGCVKEIPKMTHHTLIDPDDKPNADKKECLRSYDLHKSELDQVIDSLNNNFREIAENLKVKLTHFDARNIIKNAQEGATAAIIAARDNYCKLLPYRASIDVKVKRQFDYFNKTLLVIRNNFMMEMNAVCTHFSRYFVIILKIAGHQK